MSFVAITLPDANARAAQGPAPVATPKATETGARNKPAVPA